MLLIFFNMVPNILIAPVSPILLLLAAYSSCNLPTPATLRIRDHTQQANHVGLLQSSWRKMLAQKLETDFRLYLQISHSLFQILCECNMITTFT